MEVGLNGTDLSSNSSNAGEGSNNGQRNSIGNISSIENGSQSFENASLVEDNRLGNVEANSNNKKSLRDKTRGGLDNSSFSLKKDNKGRTLTKEQQDFFKDSKVIDDNGNLKIMYHGTKRADRVGTYFDPIRATSGPMAFFTDNQEIATRYSNDKNDTSLSREYDTEKDLFKINGESLDEYWKSLNQKNNKK